LLPVRVASQTDAARSTPVVEVVLGNGRVLRVLPGADPLAVAGLAAALER
jgi:hypothetical protein